MTSTVRTYSSRCDGLTVQSPRVPFLSHSLFRIKGVPTVSKRRDSPGCQAHGCRRRRTNGLWSCAAVGAVYEPVIGVSALGRVKGDRCQPRAVVYLPLVDSSVAGGVLFGADDCTFLIVLDSIDGAARMRCELESRNRSALPVVRPRIRTPVLPARRSDLLELSICPVVLPTGPECRHGSCRFRCARSVRRPYSSMCRLCRRHWRRISAAPVVRSRGRMSARCVRGRLVRRTPVIAPAVQTTSSPMTGAGSEKSGEEKAAATRYVFGRIQEGSTALVGSVADSSRPDTELCDR